MEMLLSEKEIRAIVEVAYAMALGGVIGFEREIQARPAGFRTHMLVAGAAAFLVASTQLLVGDSASTAVQAADPAGMRQIMNMDPLRMVEAVVAGVSFIGAGCIFASRDGDTVQGVTTAASLLMVAAIGLCTGLGYALLATCVTAMTLLVLTVLKQVERWMRPPEPTPRRRDRP